MVAQVGLLSPYIAREVLKQGKGHSEEEPLELPRQVGTIAFNAHASRSTPATQLDYQQSCSRCRLCLQVTTDVLQLIVQYLDFHRVQGRSDKVGQLPACSSSFISI